MLFTLFDKLEIHKVTHFKLKIKKHAQEKNMSQPGAPKLHTNDGNINLQNWNNFKN